MSKIEIPDPVVKVEQDFCDDRVKGWGNYLLVVTVGGVPVMKRFYSRDADWQSPEFCEDYDDAEHRVLEAFGKKIQALIGEETD